MVKSKQKSSGNTSDKENESDHCQWSSADDAILVNTLQKQKLLGFQAENGWKPQAWSAVADALKEAVLKGGEKTATKCQDHWVNVHIFFPVKNTDPHFIPHS
jgi:hypothetical protein